ncbi:TPA: phage tail tape measure protein [Escherichia coli]|nr:phage tail tape measure protein [Escherichia coli]HAN4699118.1 phage tail tape measure protein [Escherichia coli]
MSDNNLRLQVILNAVDKLTRPFRSAQASSRELAAAVKKSRDAIKQLDQAGSSLDSFRKLQAENQKLGDRLNYARQRANLLSQELGAMGPPSQRQVVALGRQRLAVQRLEERQKKLQQQTALVRAELYRAGISAKDDAGATARLARETSRYNQELSKQEARLKRLGEAQRRINAARASYARSLEVRDRIAGAGATTTAAGLAMGAPVMAAVKSYTSMEDAMKGVAKQVNGLRDDNGNRTARFYEMQDAIKAASEQLPMENGAVDFAALVEGGARMNVANPELTGTLMKASAVVAAVTVGLGTLAVALAAVLGPLAVIRLGFSVLGIKTLSSVTAAVTRTSSALSWLAGAPLALLRRGLASSGNAAGLLTAPLSSLRHTASLTGNVLKTVAGAPVALLRSGLSGLRAVAVMFMNPLAVLRGGLAAAGTVLRVLASGPLAMLRVALYAISGLLGALLSPIGLVVTALAGVALVVWKYWQPITAFLGGVVEGFKAAAGPISAAFEPLKPVFQWIGDKVQALWGWFTDLLTPVKSTSAELQSAAAMGRRFGEALAEGLNMVMHPLDSLKSGVSWLLEKLGIVSKEAAKAKLPESVTRQQPATVNADGKVMMPSGGFPSWGYGFAGMYDSGGYIPRGQFGIVGENGPEIVNGPANVTSRRNTAALAAVVAGMMGVAAAPAELPPLHPLALPAKGGEAIVSRAATVPLVQRIEAPTQIIIQTQPGQSAQDIAREVARQLDERERRLKAKARSNYSDQGGYDA